MRTRHGEVGPSVAMTPVTRLSTERGNRDDVKRLSSFSIHDREREVLGKDTPRPVLVRASDPGHGSGHQGSGRYLGDESFAKTCTSLFVEDGLLLQLLESVRVKGIDLHRRSA